MSAYLRGTDVLGALSAIDVENVKITERIDKRLVVGLPTGAILAATGLALAWKRHRVLGGALGLFVAGPALGVGSALLLSRDDFKKIAENIAKQDALKRAVVSPEKST